MQAPVTPPFGTLITVEAVDYMGTIWELKREAALLEPMVKAAQKQCNLPVLERLLEIQPACQHSLDPNGILATQNIPTLLWAMKWAPFRRVMLTASPAEVVKCLFAETHARKRSPIPDRIRWYIAQVCTCRAAEFVFYT